MEFSHESRNNYTRGPSQLSTPFYSQPFASKLPQTSSMGTPKLTLTRARETLGEPLLLLKIRDILIFRCFKQSWTRGIWTRSYLTQLTNLQTVQNPDRESARSSRRLRLPLSGQPTYSTGDVKGPE